MGEFFDWLEKLAKQPVGLLFVFGAAFVLWVTTLWRFVGRGVSYLKAIPSWWRQIRIAVVWRFRKPTLEVIGWEDVSETRNGKQLEYRLPLTVRTTNRDEGIAVVFLANLTATLVQKRGVTLRSTLKAPSTTDVVNFKYKGEDHERTIELTYEGPVKKWWTQQPLDLSKPYVIELSSVHAGIGATTDVPSGHDQTKQLWPQPKRKVVNP